MAKFNFKNVKLDGKKVVGFIGIAIAGISAIADAISKEKHDREFDEMKKHVEELMDTLGSSKKN